MCCAQTNSPAPVLGMRGARNWRLISMALPSGSAAAIALSWSEPNRPTFAFGAGSGVFSENGVSDKDVPTPTHIRALTHPTALASSASAFSSAAIVAGKVYTWGASKDGRLGHDGTTGQPAPVTGLPEAAVSVAMGEYFGLALGASGVVYGWGKRAHGHSEVKGGVGVPARVHGLPPSILAVAAGREHAVAVAVDGSVYVWGVGTSHQLGQGSKASVPSPRLLPMRPAVRIVAASAGRDHTLLLDGGGGVWAFGLNESGQCGDGNVARYCTTPTRVLDLPPPSTDPVVSLSAGENHSVVVTRGGRVYAWGAGRDGQLGQGSKGDAGLPLLVPCEWGGGRPVSASAGGEHTLVLTDKAQVWVFGRGRNGQLGRGLELESVAASRPTPVLIAPTSFLGPGGALLTPVGTAAGHEHSLVLAEDRGAGGAR